MSNPFRTLADRNRPPEVVTPPVKKKQNPKAWVIPLVDAIDAYLQVRKMTLDKGDYAGPYQIAESTIVTFIEALELEDVVPDLDLDEVIEALIKGKFIGTFANGYIRTDKKTREEN